MTNIEKRVIERFFNHLNAFGTYKKPINGGKAEGTTGKIKVTEQLIEKHISGERMPLGAHTTSPENTCKWIGLDLDISKEAKNEYLKENKELFEKEKKQLAFIIEALDCKLNNLKIPHLIEDSFGGFHIWVFFSSPLPSTLAYSMGKLLIDSFKIEIFPKQEKLSGKGFGNWLRLPGRYHSLDNTYSKIKYNDKWFEVNSSKVWEYILDTPTIEESKVKKICEAQQKEKEKEKIANQSYETTKQSFDQSSFVEGVLKALDVPGVCDDYDDFYRLAMALKSEGLTYDKVDNIFKNSSGYDYQKNIELYEGLDPRNITFGTAHYYAQKYNPEALDELIKNKKTTCKFGKCNAQIIFRKKKPYNLDGTKHNCKKNNKKKRQQEYTSEHEYWMDGNRFIEGFATKAFINQLPVPTIFSKEHFWNYKYGYWEKLEDREIKEQINIYLTPEYSEQKRVNQVLNLTSWDEKIAKKGSFEFNQNQDKINLKNGVFCLKTKKMLKHSKEYFFNYIIPTSYNPNAIARRWQRFLEEIELSSSQKIRLQEWFGYALTSSSNFNRRAEKALYLLGEGANGKSVILDTLIDMLGQDNCVSVELSELTSRFGQFRIYGKIANIVSDIKAVLGVEEKFKDFISGQTITADIKHKNAITFRPFAKQIFSANNWLPAKDRSHGFYRRFDVFKFTKTFSENEQDKHLKTFLRENELEGILNWSIQGLLRLIKNDFVFSDSPEIDLAIEEFKDRNNHVKTFLLEEEKEFKTYKYKYGEGDIKGQEKTEKFRNRYNSWCNLNGHKPLASNRLGEELSSLGVEKKRVRDKGSFYYVYVTTPKYYEIKKEIENKKLGETFLNGISLGEPPF